MYYINYIVTYYTIIVHNLIIRQYNIYYMTCILQLNKNANIYIKIWIQKLYYNPILQKMSSVTYERECRCKKNKGNGRKRQSRRQAVRGESAKATESASDCTVFPWPVSKSTLQAFSISAPYFSFLLIYRFIVQQPFWRSLNLTHPPTASRSFLYHAALRLHAVSPLIDT